MQHCKGLVDASDNGAAIKAAFQEWRQSATKRVAKHYFEKLQINVETRGPMDFGQLMQMLGQLQLGGQAQARKTLVCANEQHINVVN